MTLVKLGQNFNLLNNFSRIKQTGFNAACVKIQRHPRVETFHMTSVRRYPEAPPLPLPNNVSEIFSNETGRFSPERSRDISTPILLYENTSTKACQKSDQQTFPSEFFNNIGQTVSTKCTDNHVDSYDCFGAVSLNGIMQTNVPKPYSSRGKSTPLNMPGGQWVRDGKYIAEDMQNSHYRNQKRYSGFARKITPAATTDGVSSNQLLSVSSHTMYRPRYYLNQMDYSTDAKTASRDSGTTSDATKQNSKDIPTLSRKDKLTILVRDFGKTVIVFHVTISLISLGACYAAVVSGLDLQWIVNSIIGKNQEEINQVLSTSTSFVIAYTVHKLLAPIRISITLAATPFIVKKLRRMGILKHPELKKIEEYVKQNRRM